MYVLSKLMTAGSEFILALTIHSYGQFFVYPWGYTTDEDPDNIEQLVRRNDRGSSALTSPCALFRSHQDDVDIYLLLCALRNTVNISVIVFNAYMIVTCLRRRRWHKQGKTPSTACMIWTTSDGVPMVI